jgi:hypothetical protein
MAARTEKPNHDDKTKQLIRASQLLNRLNSFVNGEVELSAAQVNAAKVVIGKVIPDLKSVEHSGNQDKPLEMKVTWQQQK